MVLEVPSPVGGVLDSILEAEDATDISEQLLGIITEGAIVKDENPDVEVASKEPQASPSVCKALWENDLQAEDVTAMVKKGRILKNDVEASVQTKTQQPEPSRVVDSVSMPVNTSGRIDESVPMTRLRKCIAERLHGATQSAPMLTTFNEVNMQPLMDLHTEFKELFEKTHHVRLGFATLSRNECFT